MLERPSPSDLTRLQELLATCQLPHLDLTVQHLEHFLTNQVDRNVVGMVGLEINGEVALLRSLAVDPNFRGKGIGNQLVENIEAYAKERGVRDIYLLTTISFFVTLRHSNCSQCMNFACPLNIVDEKVRAAFFERNPTVARAWGRIAD